MTTLDKAIIASYIREGKVVDFPGDWRKLCESCGLVTLHEHHALLVEEHGIQRNLFEEADTFHKTSKKSFFRRLAENRGSPTIDYEVIYCMEKNDGKNMLRLSDNANRT